MPETEKTDEKPVDKTTTDEEKASSTVGAAVDSAEAAAEARIRARKENNELTKRLQKLALERQKESKGDRLKVIQSDTNSHLSGAKTFQELNLPKPLLDGIFGMGFDRPSAIQEEALPRILANPPRNLIGQAQSGSGKTAAFTLGMLYRIKVDDPPTCQALCVTPTRELAIQIVDKAVKPMGQNMEGLKIQLAIAGVTIERGKKVDAHLVVGTPGKVVDWLKRKTIDPKTIKVFVLDEADNMVEEDGHRANSILIKKNMPKKCQCLLFSATFPEQVVNFASKMVVDPDKILIEDGPEFLVSIQFRSLWYRSSTRSLIFSSVLLNLILSFQVVDVIKQLWVDTREYDGGKLAFLADIYSLLTITQSIVFVETKRDADMVHKTLADAGYTCSVLHGGIDNDARDITMQDFRDGKSTVLITTNVLARGVDVDNVGLVINYDMPVEGRDKKPDFETYLHRIGRTGRFGRKGTAINLVNDASELQVLAAIERYFAKDKGKEMISKAEADPEALAEMISI